RRCITLPSDAGDDVAEAVVLDTIAPFRRELAIADPHEPGGRHVATELPCLVQKGERTLLRSAPRDPDDEKVGLLHAKLPAYVPANFIGGRAVDWRRAVED